MRRARDLVGWGVAAVCLGFMVWYFSEHREELALLRRLRVADLLALAGLYAAYLLVQAVRYRDVLQTGAKARIGLGAWLRLFLLGRLLNFVLPQSGNLYRAAELSRRHDVRVTRFVASLAGFAWLESALTLALTAAALALLAPGLRLAGQPLAAGLAGLAIAALAAPFLLERAARRLRIRSGAAGWVQARAAVALEFTMTLARRPLFLARFLALGLATLTLGAALFAVTFRALGIAAGGVEVLLFLLLLRAGAAVHLTPGNLGVMELGFGLLGREIGIGLGEGLLVSALLRVAGLAVLAAMALPLGGLRLLRREAAAEPVPGAGAAPRGGGP